MSIKFLSPAYFLFLIISKTGKQHSVHAHWAVLSWHLNFTKHPHYCLLTSCRSGSVNSLCKISMSWSDSCIRQSLIKRLISGKWGWEHALRSEAGTLIICSFCVMVAQARNSLLPTVTSEPSLTVFKRQLKTFLFKYLFFVTVYSTLCPEKKRPKCVFVIFSIKLERFWWNLVRCFVNKFASKWC